MDSTNAAASNGPNNGALPTLAPATTTSAPAPATTSAGGGASFSPAPSLYRPQFSAATEMILKRMKGESSTLTSALSAASPAAATMTLPSIRPGVPLPTYEDVRRRIVMDMSTTLTMKAPTMTTSSSLALPVPSAKVASTLAFTTNRRIPPAAAKPKPAANKVAMAAKKPAAKPSPAKAGIKRKRGRPSREGETSPLTSLSSDSEVEAPTSATKNASSTANKPLAPPPPPTTTKSGRQVQKPNTYNPAAMELQTKKRTHYGKRTAEQALCRRCSRMHSPHSNQMVFCDGCNEGWHQMCHEPWIEDDVVKDVGGQWFCAACQAKRDRQLGSGAGGGSAAKRRKENGAAHAFESRRVSWMAKTTAQKRAYLTSLHGADLVNLLMYSLELHPDLPIFPSADATPNGTPRSLFASNSTDGLFTRVESTPNGQLNYVRKASGKGKGSPANGLRTSGHGYVGARDSRENSPLRQAWPRPGMGLYSRLPPEMTDTSMLVDENDFESFSVIVYDEHGRKISEDGKKV